MFCLLCEQAMRGLVNLHWSCFANAVIQGLSACPAFRTAIFASSHDQDHQYEDEVSHQLELKPVVQCIFEALKKAITHKSLTREMEHLLRVMRNTSEFNTQ